VGLAPNTEAEKSDWLILATVIDVPEVFAKFKQVHAATALPVAVRFWHVQGYLRGRTDVVERAVGIRLANDVFVLLQDPSGIIGMTRVYADGGRNLALVLCVR
jgi:hypothetical protein